jgi:hypothetical protein
MSYKGKFQPKNSQKYNGDPTKITYRSLWERKFMKFCDDKKNILQWSSEEVIVPYRSPIDNRMHRYYVDFLVTSINRNGIKETLLIEVKPKRQCKPPKKKSRVTKGYIKEVKAWGINSAKWEAATEYAENKGWKFIILTEDDLLV